MAINEGQSGPGQPAFRREVPVLLARRGMADMTERSASFTRLALSKTCATQWISEGSHPRLNQLDRAMREWSTADGN